MGESIAQPESRGQRAAEQQAMQRITGAALSVAPLLSEAADGVVNGVLPVLPRSHLEEELRDAEHLLLYAAQSGIDVGVEVRRTIVSARLSAAAGWTEQRCLEVLSALTALSATLRPVSGESLRKCAVNAEAMRTILKLRVAAIALALIVVPFSVAAFVASSVCEDIHKDIELANALTVTLARQAPAHPPVTASSDTLATPGPPASDLSLHSEDELKRLQQFAATIRSIDRRAVQLKHVGFFWVEDPFLDIRGKKQHESFNQKFNLPPGGFVFETELPNRIGLYQEVRSFAQNVQEMVQASFGAVTLYVLPMLYALLGACAFLIRSFEEQRKTRTFTSNGKMNARLLIAAIGGLVVGLFRDFSDGHSAGLSPLAIAFMVGYGIDVFFYFIDGALQTFGRPRTERAPEIARGQAAAAIAR